MRIYLAGSVRYDKEEEKICKEHGYRLHSFFYKKEVNEILEMKRRLDNENTEK